LPRIKFAEKDKKLNFAKKIYSSVFNFVLNLEHSRDFDSEEVEKF